MQSVDSCGKVPSLILASCERRVAQWKSVTQEIIIMVLQGLFSGSNIQNFNFPLFDQILPFNGIWLSKICFDCKCNSDKHFSFRLYISLNGHFSN